MAKNSYARELEFQKKVDSSRRLNEENKKPSALLREETDAEFMSKAKRIQRIESLLMLGDRISDDERKREFRYLGVADARMEGGAVYIVPMKDTARFFGLGDSLAVGYQNYFTSGADGRKTSYIIHNPSKAGLVRGGSENNRATVDHEISHVTDNREENTHNVPWGDRPQERRAEQYSLDQFKKRLEAQGIAYTPEMGVRFFRGDYAGALENKSQSPVRYRPSYIPSSAPIQNSAGQETQPLKYAEALDLARKGKSGLRMFDFATRLAKKDKRGRHGQSADILRTKLAYGK